MLLFAESLIDLLADEGWAVVSDSLAFPVLVRQHFGRRHLDPDAFRAVAFFTWLGFQLDIVKFTVAQFRTVRLKL